MRIPTLLLATGLGFVLPLASACGDKDGDGDGGSADGGGTDGGTDGGGTDGGGGSSADADSDGYSVEDGDCNDGDPTVHPGLTELCDGIDQNCNELTDEGFTDTDGDTLADCVDVEDCDGQDNDGDGEIDEGYPDTDSDGHADCESEEICDGMDNNGDGTIDEGFDFDDDGFTTCGSKEEAPDCNDRDADINPGADELSRDLIDNDCDGAVDEGDWDRGDFFITEIMNNPRNVIDSDGEWFEIYNDSGRDLVLNGMVITSGSDDDYHVVEADEYILLAPGEYFVFASNADPVTNGDVEVDYAWWDGVGSSEIGLSNESDELVLMVGDVIVDEVSWDDGMAMPDPQGATILLDPSFYGAIQNDDPEGWCDAQLGWGTLSDLGSPGADNEFCWPVADARYDTELSTLYTCDTIYLLGNNSYDPDGASITYEWELVDAPAASDKTSADIVLTTDTDPEFNPDEAGTYLFALTVFNGTEYSPPDYLSVDVMLRPDNHDPVADAGDDISYSGDAICNPISYGAYYTCHACDDLEFTVDGSSSYDPDDDPITSYTWEITGGTASGEIDDPDSASTTVTMSGGTPDYGGTATTTLELTLTVEDCMSATGTDVIVVTYECSGT